MCETRKQLDILTPMVSTMRNNFNQLTEEKKKLLQSRFSRKQQGFNVYHVLLLSLLLLGQLHLHFFLHSFCSFF